MNKQDYTYNPKSYGSILLDRQKFKKAGVYGGDDFNLYDTPGQKYFKIFFYFWNGDIYKKNAIESGGLLAPLWQLYNDSKTITDDNLWQYTAAWTYLKLNGEEERAYLLEKFVELLSNINSESPWYFQQVDGLADALDRQQTMKDAFLFEEGRQKITLKCLPDAYDDRISTLLDLYKAIVWSWQNKRFILPANLRKFDMGIYIFESPIKNIHNPNTQSYLLKSSETDYAIIDKYPNKNAYQTSSKYIEFHNCEIDYNSARNAFTTLDNIEGIYPTHNIEIFFDDCYEVRYNEFMDLNIGDIITRDTETFTYDLATIKSNLAANDKSEDNNISKDSNQAANSNQFEEFEISNNSYQKKINNIHSKQLESRSDIYRSPGPVTTASKELIGFGTSWLKSQAKHLLLGNMHGLSISKVKDQVDAMSLGHLWSTVSAVKQYTDNKKSAKTKHVTKIGNMFKSNTIANNL